jgi:hypothetical protein
MTALVLILLRALRWLSLRRPRIPGRPWPGLSHARLCARILRLELRIAEEATDQPWTAEASARVDRALAAHEEHEQ